ncbi:hypothetical protein BD560DRAFT_474754 [Blakeslea trispora]|nr:hypothetical protein BD560DRAFT_474754 [Blakeslea trispora]
MKSTSFFGLSTSLFLSTLTLVVADTWIASMVCEDKLTLLVQHRNDLGWQTVTWKQDQVYSDSKSCSDDEIICIRDVLISRTNCEKASADFKVQHGNAWSRYTHMDFSTTYRSEFGFSISDPFFFKPEFL